MFTVEISGDNERELIKQAAFWQSIPAKCPVCGAPLILNYRTPQTFTYYELLCLGTPSHSVNFGESRGSHDLYYDTKKTWKAYTPNAIEQGDRTEATPETASGSRTPKSALPAATDSGPNANIGELKNRLIKLITRCKDAGIRSGFMPADVAKMDEATIIETGNKLDALLDAKAGK